MMTTRRKMFAGFAALLLPALMIAGDAEIRLRTRLAGGAIGGLTPSGSSEFRSRGARAQFKVEVEDVNVAAGTQLGVFLNGTQVGTITVSPAPIRGGEFEANTQDGDVVPTAAAGDLVVVRNGSAAVVSGVLR